MSQGQDIIICNYLFLSRIPTCHKTLASKVMYKDHVISYEQSAHDESLVTPRSQRDYFSNLVLLNSNNKTLSKNNKSPSTSVCLSRPSHPQQLLISPIFCAQQLQRACSMVHMKHRQPPPPPPPINSVINLPWCPWAVANLHHWNKKWGHPLEEAWGQGA